jgi:ubiquinone biosynthesis protein COQ4
MPSVRPLPVRLAAAARAMKALTDNPDDTAQVFRIIEALSGNSGQRNLGRLKRTRTGADLLRDRPELIEILTDHDRLRKLPDGSLGREYVRFLESEGITAAGLKQASLDGRQYGAHELPAELEFLRNRMRDTHDLWHVVTGYKGDLLGEAALLAFIFAQTRNPGVGFIVAIALLRGREPAVRQLILQGFLRGLRADWLPAVKWEKLLALPIDRVRQMLHVDEPPRYMPFRSTEYFKRSAA